jgi:hypothetical protein
MDLVKHFVEFCHSKVGFVLMSGYYTIWHGPRDCWISRTHVVTENLRIALESVLGDSVVVDHPDRGLEVVEILAPHNVIKVTIFGSV